VPLSPAQIAMRRRLEAGLKVVGPGLDLLLLGGDRLSRVLDRSPDTWTPPHRMEGAAARAQLAAQAGRDGDAPEDRA
jgi:hypothetical protein